MGETPNAVKFDSSLSPRHGELYRNARKKWPSGKMVVLLSTTQPEATDGDFLQLFATRQGSSGRACPRTTDFSHLPGTGPHLAQTHARSRRHRPVVSAAIARQGGTGGPASRGAD